VVRQDGKELEAAVARYAMNPDGESCEFAIVVADAWQTKGIGMRLMTMLMEAAKARGYRTMIGEVLADNVPMLRFMKKLGFSAHTLPESSEVYGVTKDL
jgi:acetyltransferase